ASSQYAKNAFRSRSYAASVCGESRRSVRNRPRNSAASLGSIALSRRALLRERDRHELAEAAENIHPLARMEMLRVAAADDQKAAARVTALRHRADRHHRGGLDAVGVALEYVFLPVPQQSAARTAGAQERRIRAEHRIGRLEPPDETVAREPAGRTVLEQDEQRPLREKLLAQRRLELLESCRRRRRGHQAHREPVHLLDERVVLLRDRDQLLQLPLELGAALTEHRDLPLDERDRGAAR